MPGGGSTGRALFDGALLTIDGALAAEAAAVLGARRVVPAHCDSWAHFSEGRDDVVAAFTTSGRSVNVVDALRTAQQRGATTVLFGGGDGGPAAAHADHRLLVPSTGISVENVINPEAPVG